MSIKDVVVEWTKLNEIKMVKVCKAWQLFFILGKVFAQSFCKLKQPNYQTNQ